ncbi:MAG: recombinase RecT [Acidimicrobiales bacterium]
MEPTRPAALNLATAREQLASARERAARTPTAAPATETRNPAPRKGLAGVLDPIASDIARALPERVDAQRFTEAVLIALRSIDIAGVEPSEIRRGVTRLAHLGLELGLGQLVNLYVQKNKVGGCMELAPRPTYRGVIELARRSGDVRSVVASVIYEEEKFETWADERGQHIVHRPALDPQSPMIGAYAFATGNDGHLITVVTLSKAEIERRRAYSRRANAGPWVDHYDAMARKTAILALVPFLPLSPARNGVIEPADVLNEQDFASEPFPVEAVQADPPEPPAVEEPVPEAEQK